MEREQDLRQKLDTLRRWISEAQRVVFFGGAGVSTESGIPDFRSVDGLYNQKYDYPPETIISHSFFQHDPETFCRFYRDKLNVFVRKAINANRRRPRRDVFCPVDDLLRKRISADNRVGR